MSVGALRYRNSTAIARGDRIVDEVLPTLTTRHVHAHPAFVTGVRRHGNSLVVDGGVIPLRHFILFRGHGKKTHTLLRVPEDPRSETMALAPPPR